MQFVGILGIIIFLVILFLMSDNRKQIRWKYPIILLVLSIALAFIFLNTKFGIAAANGVSAFFNYLTTAAMSGIQFVFGGTIKIGETTTFFLNTLMPILFISVLVGLLLKFGLLQFISKWLGKALGFISGEDDLISFNSINAFMLSQSGVFVSAKEFIDDLAPRQIYALAICGVSTISSTIIGAYLQMVEPKYVVTATVMNMLMGLLVINIVFPRDVESEGEVDMSFIENRPAGNILQVIGDYATTGFNTVVAIGISLMAFLALIQLLNMICSGLFHIDFQHILGYVFYPVAWIMGAGKDSLEVGNLIATKLVSNEFVAISGMAKMHLSEHAKAITSVALLSFANLSSIGIVGGAISGVSTKQSDVYYKKGFKVLFAAFISSLLIGSIVGLFVA